MIHLKANLEQAARFSIRIENKRAAESALKLMDAGKLKTRGDVKLFIERALDKAKEQREILK